MAVQLTIRAKINEEIIDGVGVPKSVNIKDAGFLAPSVLVDIAQETIKAYTGTEFSEYLAVMPDWDKRTDDMDIAVIKRRL